MNVTNDLATFRASPVHTLVNLSLHFAHTQLVFFRLLPSRLLSRVWGQITSKHLPTWLRKPLLGLYVWLFGCRMEEARIVDLKEYPSLLELFTRQLKPGVRTIDNECALVSVDACMFNIQC